MNEIVSTQLLTGPVMGIFVACTTVLVLKMLALQTWTSAIRVQKKVFASPEDYAFQGETPKEARDADVERVRRAHRNDMENVLPFLVVGWLYALTGPSVIAAWILFGGFTLARVAHGLLYLRGLMPHRTIAYVVGFTLQVWMTLVTFWKVMVA
jgi:glutathione S-transferase